MGARKVNSVKSETQVDEETFLSTLMKNLIEAKNKHPDQYSWPDADVLDVFRRLAQSMREGTYSRHSHPIRWTCKELGIKHDRDAIDQIFNGNQN